MGIFFLVILLNFVQLLALEQSVILQCLKEKAPQWMQTQIQTELNAFTTELSKKSLDRLFQMPTFPFIRVCVKGGDITITQNQKTKEVVEEKTIKEITHGINQLGQWIQLPDIDFIVDVNDVLLKHEIIQIIQYMKAQDKLFKIPPIFIESKDISGLQAGILMPCRYSAKGYLPEKNQMLLGNQRFSNWKEKIPKLFFRGKDSRTSDIPRIWFNSSRVKLAFLANKYPDQLDIKILVDHHKHMKNISKEWDIYDNLASFQEYSKFKYLLDIDGNGSSRLRLPLLMFSNSLIFRLETNLAMWWHSQLKAFKHYISISHDLIDIFYQIHWAETHQSQCQNIVNNASYLANSVLSEEATYTYLYHLLCAYSKKQKEYY